MCLGVPAVKAAAPLPPQQPPVLPYWLAHTPREQNQQSQQQQPELKQQPPPPPPPPPLQAVTVLGAVDDPAPAVAAEVGAPGAEAGGARVNFHSDEPVAPEQQALRVENGHSSNAPGFIGDPHLASSALTL